MLAERERADSDSSGGVDRAVVRRRLRRHAAAIEREELEAAVAKLESRTDVSDVDRVVLADLATALTDAVLEPAERALTEAQSDDVARTVADLYDPEF